MDFDFLPQLPKSDLDDRAFKDLVQECLLRIPRYCPEWTNHNPGDPGITLIELFAWLTDQMLLRFNQVPRRNYVVFLEMLGIRLLPPTPARTDLTFYLSQAQPGAIIIPNHTEVATVRTETEAAVIFTTDESLVVGIPQIKHFLHADTCEAQPSFQGRDNRFHDSIHERDRQWLEMGRTELFRQSQPGNCFYLVLEERDGLVPDERDRLAPEEEENSYLKGNVIAINVKGEPATGTGIIPDNAPIQWEAWDGQTWQPILRVREDDQTKGFSFHELAQAGLDPVKDGADVVLHLPKHFPRESFSDYSGYWIRCIYTDLTASQSAYNFSPAITELSVRAIGGTVGASQCVQIKEELLGVSDGRPGQTFQLQGRPVLERRSHEHIQVHLPGQPVEDWQEVPDFADSGPNAPHYTLDAITGTVQFGPLVREPLHLKQQIQQREQLQAWGRTMRQETNGAIAAPALPTSDLEPERLERQYGRVPPPGAEIYMQAYRSGGGSFGNVQAGKLKVLKTAIPYVKSVINHHDAQGGSDPESLSQAVMRVPQLLRTRETAVTPEDFERTALRSHSSIGRVRCLTQLADQTPGVIGLLVVPRPPAAAEPTSGTNPDTAFQLTEALRESMLAYLADRKPLGIQVRLAAPEYVRVKVYAEIVLDERYRNGAGRTRIRQQLLSTLYQFIHPLTGGLDGKGWEWGRSLYPSDVIARCQAVPGVQYVGMVKLFKARKTRFGWERMDLPEPAIHTRPNSLLCSWADGEEARWDGGHEVAFVE
ncbi:MAG: putative baseplate assembly protein [Elainellaceae cyanobacterium]